MMQKTFVLFLMVVQLGYSSDYYYKNHQKISLNPVIQQRNKPIQRRYYKNTKGIQMGITNKILIKLSKGEFIEYYLKKYYLKQVKQLGDRLYLVTVDSIDKTLDISNALHRERGILYAHPDFIKQRVLR